MNGNFAAAFGDFMSDYWSTRSQGIARAPRQVKRVIGNFARQFDGFAQHDSQEVSPFFVSSFFFVLVSAAVGGAGTSDFAFVIAVKTFFLNDGGTIS